MSNRGIAAALAWVLVAAICAGGQVATVRLHPAPATASAPVATAPAEQVDPSAMKILRRLEAAAGKFPLLTAELDYREDLLQVGDVERRSGKVYYQAAAKDTPARFRIHFDTLRQGDGPKRKNVEDYAFDGEWFTLRKERPKQHHERQVVAPGEKLEALELGRGPFPIPFGQKVETVLKHFRVSTRPPASTDPKGCDYLKCVTRPAQKRELNVVWLEMWVQRETGLPIRIVAEDASQNRKTVQFDKIDTPKSFSDKTFRIPPPRPGSGWEYKVYPMEKPGAARAGR
jgi:hypothetical protein